MDPHVDADDEAAMAQMMGFSTFGATQDKKRKYNPNADAATGTPPQQARRPVVRASTGSNATPLGQAQRREADHAATATATNTDEIDLDFECDSAPTTADPLAQGVALSSSLASARPAGLPERPPPAVGLFASPFTEPLPSQQRHDRQPNNNDPSRGPWYEGYYDPSSNENPWARLEMAMDLPPKGTWIPRGNPSTVAAMAT